MVGSHSMLSSRFGLRTHTGIVSAVEAMLLAVLGALASACGNPGTTTYGNPEIPDVKLSDAPADLGLDTGIPEIHTKDSGNVEAQSDLGFDFGTDQGEPACAPGQGCFLDPCTKNSQCLSGWCVEHLGEGVCTSECQEECPDGWECKQVESTGPDVAWVCVSRFSNLCKPCSTAADCSSPGGLEDACLDYAAEGSFCGGTCTTNEDCPSGFTCKSVKTVDGVTLDQCVSEAGTCPCTAKSVALGLWTPCTVGNDWGTCMGKRVCTGDGLTSCDADTPAQEICNGLDDDCDGTADEPDVVRGSFLNLCDDDNPCTTDACEGESGCTHEIQNAGECIDGDACTVGDHCENGQCVGLPVVCDDGNPCTDDACDGQGGCKSTLNNAPCDDQDPCTVADACKDGTCGGVSINCDCKTDSDCAAFEDGDFCNGTLTCDTSVVPHECILIPGSIISCPQPQGPDSICQKAVCAPLTGECAIQPDHEGFACSDGNSCTLGDACSQGKCQSGSALVCADNNPCTDDACNPQVGCVFSFNESPCSDGNACTTGDVCKAGVCGANGLLSCDDSNPCTTDGCDVQAGCTHLADDQAQCSDGNACTAGDSCKAGQCVPGSPLICDDANPCTTDSCTVDGGCLFKLNDLPCNDGNLCTAGDHCHLGGCIGGQSLVCNDSNPCTDDSCDPKVGCVFKANVLPCDDGNACTLGDVCSSGWCKGTSSLSCDDGNPCTTDSCKLGVGCLFENNNLPCDDGNACTAGDSCSAGTCAPGTPLECDDSNACTTDSCLPATGCKHVDTSASCADLNPCTTDSCDPATGCVHGFSNQPCDDGSACTSGDVCFNGACKGGPLIQCSDGKPCTQDTCDPALGCVYPPIAPCCGNSIVEAGESCDDGNNVGGDGCSAVCITEGPACVTMGVDVRTLEQTPDKWKQSSCQTLCENTPTVIPAGWHIATKEEVAHLTKKLSFGSCAAYGICGSYWYGSGGELTAGCSMLHYTCPTGGCTAYTSHCYTQVLLIRDGRVGTCTTN